jgi:hypothetical protein
MNAFEALELRQSCAARLERLGAELARAYGEFAGAGDTILRGVTPRLRQIPVIVARTSLEVVGASSPCASRAQPGLAWCYAREPAVRGAARSSRGSGRGRDSAAEAAV